MPLQPTDARLDEVLKGASGLNDFISPLKLPNNLVPAGLNFLADGDEWKRRQGRDFYYLFDGDAILSIHSLSWSDGLTTYITQADDVFYDITPTFTYFFRSSARWILQDRGGKYWDVTPGFTTGLIWPTVISTPSAAPQTESLVVSSSESIAFAVDGGSIELESDFQHNGWYLQSNTNTLGASQFTSDVVFTYASGFSIVKQDSALNNWKFSVSDIGELIVTTI